MSEALFSYRVRVSSRSRSIRLRVTPVHGLEVVLPRGYETVHVPALIAREERWIRAALERVESYRKSLEVGAIWVPPPEIALTAAGVVWYVSATKTSACSVTVRERGLDRLAISGAIDDERACRAALGRWLVRRAHVHLMARLQVLSRETGLRCTRASIRRQKTRWGSCSQHGSISLNAKLLFVPRELVDYVLIHELCHLTELNHSRRFWALVERYCPDFRERDRRLRIMWSHIPPWAN